MDGGRDREGRERVEQPVLVPIVEPMQDGCIVLGGVWSAAWLASLDDCHRFRSYAREASAPESTIPRVPGGANREREVLLAGLEGGFTQTRSSDGANEVVESGANVGGAFPSPDGADVHMPA
jgi:hypothetical protein